MAVHQRSTEATFAWRPVLRLTAALTLLGAAVIHVTQIRIHLDEWAAAGVFFIALAVGQGLLGIVLLVREPRPLSIAAVVLSLVAIAVWAISRTAGIPFGPEAGVAEPVERPDSLATLFEVVTILTLIPLLRARARHDSSGSLRGPGYFAMAVASVSIAALTTYAIQPVQGCGHHGEGNEKVAQKEQQRDKPDKRSRHDKVHDEHKGSPTPTTNSRNTGSKETPAAEEAEEC